MDKETIDTYNREAERIAQLHLTLTPSRLYDLIELYFIKNGSTLDVGCGIGRDTNWLANRDYSVIGLDASEGMLEQARKYYPQITFKKDFLPDLRTLADAQFQNILCSAVLMHLDYESIKKACLRLLQLLTANGYLILSVRRTNELNKRENGKLYEPIDIKSILQFFKENNSEILLCEKAVEVKRQLTWHTIVIRK